MKRGRPAMREEFRRQILMVLGKTPYPITVTNVRRLVEARRTHPCGWDTIQKYLQELVAERLVLREPLPPQPKRKPLVLYRGRRHQTRSKSEFLGTFSRDGK